ncbi:phosphatidylglycerol:prolipoprotein diacylglycerol transferase [Desulfuromusa kysingii]|uniref:Phosphatidylglycerol--prolipoprotein diacylglyceryl transferase n=1 Tax=Desulfuromusa kysingii TaxID=37625 RepID=A0A1H3YD96_9BACT|nr:prolipoprotein diacylglyceryl transferase [Desulfuromusa kysingii]SEA09577.1 phosphatidylglycerol:prolipoprotein diacylglycerol transferase [Desulfuromusa kysingii]
MNFPHIDPVIFSLGPLAVRWYGMMYLLGFLGGYLMMCHIVRLRDMPIKKEVISDLLFYAVLGVVFGGRLGYTLFYNTEYYLHHPLKILFVWEGGMSFHGGLIGVFIVLLIFCRVRHLDLILVADLVVAAVPIGLFFGRIGNFINSELWGRVTDLPWGVVFPHGGPLPRHPSQLYEAGLEGLFLFVMIYLLHRNNAARGIPVFSFLFMYGLFRFIIEFVRQPDEQLGFLWWGATMGQLLSTPMILIGLTGLVYFCKRGKS